MKTHFLQKYLEMYVGKMETVSVEREYNSFYRCKRLLSGEIFPLFHMKKAFAIFMFNKFNMFMFIDLELVLHLKNSKKLTKMAECPFFHVF